MERRSWHNIRRVFGLGITMDVLMKSTTANLVHGKGGSSTTLFSRGDKASANVGGGGREPYCSGFVIVGS